jgi:hypothetical protein
MQADNTRIDNHRAGMDEEDILDLLELQRLTRELRDHLVGMFPSEDVVDLLRALADGLEARTRN